MDAPKKVKIDLSQAVAKLKAAGDIYDFTLQVKICQLQRLRPELSNETARASALRLIDDGAAG